MATRARSQAIERGSHARAETENRRDKTGFTGIRITTAVPSEKKADRADLQPAKKRAVDAKRRQVWNKS